VKFNQLEQSLLKLINIVVTQFKGKAGVFGRAAHAQTLPNLCQLCESYNNYLR